MSATDESSREPGPPADPSGRTPWEEMQDSEEFKALRNRWRRYIFAMSGFFLAWFLVYVLLAAFAQDFVNQRAIGNITVGLILGLLQFLTTFVIAVLYAKFADKNIDPDAERLKTEMEAKLP